MFLNKFTDIFSIEIGRNRLVMENSVFLSFDGSKLVSHIKIYENNSKQKIHLIPVCHFGTYDYFHDIVAYVGEDIPCIFENIKIGSELDKSHKPLKNLDDFIEIYSNIYDKFWNECETLIKKFNKKYVGKEIKQLQKLAKREVYKSNDKIMQIYELCEKVNFSITSMLLIQVYWAEILDLEHQFMAIDYENDIPSRSNWCHGDLNFGAVQNKLNITELTKQALTSPTQTQISETQKEMSLILQAILGAIQLCQLNPVSQRRKEIAEVLIDSMKTENQAFEEQSPEFLLKTRNMIVERGISIFLEDFDEIMVFYGAYHMIAIEQFLLGGGFELKAEKCFDIFDINYY
jgi:hypothetical protein